MSAQANQNMTPPMTQPMTRSQAILAVDKALRVARTNRPFSGDMRERFLLAARLLADFGMEAEPAPIRARTGRGGKKQDQPERVR